MLQKITETRTQTERIYKEVKSNFKGAFLDEVEILRSWKTKMDEGFGDLSSQDQKVIENYTSLLESDMPTSLNMPLQNSLKNL